MTNNKFFLFIFLILNYIQSNKKSWKNITPVKYLENKTFEEKTFPTKVVGF